MFNPKNDVLLKNHFLIIFVILKCKKLEET